jgi:phage FluMu gp28-like protein
MRPGRSRSPNKTPKIQALPEREPQLIDWLKPYQARWVKDASRWKFGLWSRQSGKDWCSAFEGIRDCAEAEAREKKTTWLIAAPSERQSLESLEKWKEWAKAAELLIDDYSEERVGPQALLKAATITFPHGSRVIAVPGKPDTVRGYSANVLLTEFAFFEEPDLTWRAILPSITNPLRGGEKKVRLITTPNGIGNKAHEIWTQNYRAMDNGQLTMDNGKSAAARAVNYQLSTVHSPPSTVNSQWSCHFVDVYQAARDGLPIDIEEIKAALNDPEGWAQEFECQFLDTQVTLLPYELIASCESAEASESCAPEFWQAAVPAPLYMGIDYGRRRDLTVAWTVMRQGKALRTVEVLALDNVPGPDQEEILSARIRRCARVCVDATGPGQNFGEHLAREFGQYDPERHLFGKIELCAFSNTLKQEIYPNLRLAFEKKLVLVPASRAVREDLHSVNRVTTPGGQISYRAPHTADGHADRCAALALATRAGSGAEAEEGGFHIVDSRINRVLAARRERSIA